MILNTAAFNYLDESDAKEFEEHLGTVFQEILVSGRKTLYRIEKYIPEKEYYRIRVVLTALVRDFNLSAVRYTGAIALAIYAMVLQRDDSVLVETKNVVSAELALLLEHLMSDNDDDGNSERELFERDFEMVTKRWSEYLKAPSEFVL
jgi:hypothetical protein